MMSDEANLLARLQNGEDAARREVYERHSGRLHRWFVTRVPTAADSDDCVSETFTRCWESLSRGNGPTESLGQWLWGIARNVLNERYRVNAREVITAVEEFDTADGTPGDDGSLDRAGKRAAIEDAWEIIQTLSESRRIVLTSLLEESRRQGREVKGAELAGHLGARWPRSRVDRELNRARDDVRQRMGVLAVARGGCGEITGLVADRRARLRFAELPGEVVEALMRHANAAHAATGDNRTASLPTPGCKRCQTVFRDAQRPGLYALGPGLLLLARYTDPDEEERRRVLAEIGWALPLRPAAVGASGTIPPVAVPTTLAQRGWNAVVTSLSRVTQLPAVSNLLHSAQNNPVATGGFATVVAATVALLALLTGDGGVSIATQQSPSPTSSVTAPSTTPAVEPPVGPDGSPAVSPLAQTFEGGGPSPAPPGTGDEPLIGTPCDSVPARAIAHVPAPQPFAVAQGFALRSDGAQRAASRHVSAQQNFPIVIDTRQLSYRRFYIPGVTSTSGLDSQVPQTLSLPPGVYNFQFASGFYAAFQFRVTATGQVDYDPSYGSFLSGSGTATLTIAGFPVTLDARGLTGIGVLLYQNYARYHQVRLVPANLYQVQHPGAVGGFQFRLGLDGNLTYDASLDVAAGGYLRGNGTTTLEFVGYPVSVDASSLAYKRFYLPGVLPEGVGPETVPTVHVLPGSFAVQFASGYYADFRFTVDRYGLIRYDSAHESFLSGAGGKALKLDGLAVTIDARRLSGSGVLLANMPGQQFIRYREMLLLPGSHYTVQQSSGQVSGFKFRLRADGKFEYAAAFDTGRGGFLGGAGTSTLEIAGYPVCLDARAAGVSAVNLYPVVGMPYDTSGTQVAYLLPGSYELQTNPGGRTGVWFTLTADGNFTVNDGSSAHLRLDRINGVAVLTVLQKL